MADFTTVMTGTAQISTPVLVALNGAFTIAKQADDIIPQIGLQQFSNDADKRTFSFARLNELDEDTDTTLLEREDPVSRPMSGSVSSVTAVEHGLVVTTTALADTISGGALGRQAAAAVGRSAARWQNKRAMAVLGAGTNALFAGTAGTEAGVAAGDVMTRALMNKAYTRLGLAGATKDGFGMYRAILHTAQIHDLRAATDAGSWLDTNKYARPEDVLRNEVGSIAGIRVIEANWLAPADQSGAGTVDLYKAVFFGANALGAGYATPMSLRITGPFDKLGRFLNYGWYTCQIMSIIDQNEVYVISTSSSEGANA